jgi:hypothetical protein
LIGSIGLKTEQESSRGRMGWFQLLHSKRVIDRILSLNQNSSTKNVFGWLSRAVPIPGLQAILNKKGFKQYSDNILAVLKLQHPSSAETETATSQQYSSN